MRLPAEERSRIERRLGSADDAVTVANVIETLANHVKHTSSAGLARLHYELEAPADADRFTLQLTRGIDVFTNEYVRAVRSASTRVLDVRLNAREKRVDVEMARAAAEPAPEAASYVPAESPRRRHLSIDFEPAAVVDAADRRLIDSLVDAVYTSVARVPAAMSFWFEPVHEGDDASSAASRHVADDDGSVSEAPVGAIVGYSLCFAHAPVVSAAFLDHLATQHSAALASAYMWFTAPARVCDGPLFVLNVRAASTPVSATKRIVKNNTPRGLATVPMPAKKRARAQ